MNFCWGLSTDRNLIEKNEEEVIQAEKYGFNSVLIGSKDNSFDPWIMASHLGSLTSKIRFLIAQNTNSTLPLNTAKSLSSLMQIIGPRVDLNIVSGRTKTELHKDDSHVTRYNRTSEYVQIINEIKEDYKFSFSGDHFNIENYQLKPKLNGNFNICVAGSSEQALDIACSYSNYYLVYANSIDWLTERYSKVLESTANKVKCGLLIDVIARDTTEEAWNVAQRLNDNFSLFQKKIKQLYLNNTDSEGVLAHKKLLEYDNFIIGDNLWSGLAQVSKSVPVSIVGSYQEVINTIIKLREIGADYFIFTGIARDREIERIGENILPFIK
ncbi:LLM class flavin-dependent oxidoreductase [Oceanobacillus sp. CFH 90083]|uniref:LLM class flavin-dependent oxidoreductase n=1 Tax=Oceanobacillus sp. CFH 90083 TaxID=2592336 RepID=UPI00128CDD55|nr:LLM class flavin-dependent oxidoreductase [Oceanobacillus sp. CFH 90083]